MRTTFWLAGIAALIAAAPGVAAERVTFYKDVLPIVQENCQACHRAGGANLGGMVAPMAFETFEETRPWAKAMAKAVESGKMPPWHASEAQHGLFDNERTITDEQVATIVKWAQTGAARGQAGDAPPKREWPDYDGWTIGKPDAVFQPDEPFFVEDDVEDLYVYLTTTMTEEMLPEDKYIKSVEFRPGSSVVHHIITMPLGGIAPGNDPTVYPDGIASKLHKGTDLTWEMHYHKEPGPDTGVMDHSSVAVRYYDDPSKVEYRMQGNDLGVYDFTIPAGDRNYTRTAEYVFSADSKIVSLMPHFHLRGKWAKYEAFYPDGTSEVLLDVPRYDFNWQTAFNYKEFKEVPKGTKVVFTAAWDNSADNPYNPDPTVDVYYGEPTTDEMFYGYISFINDSGDHENFFDNLTGGEDGQGDIDLVALVFAYDDDHSRTLEKQEAPSELHAYWAFIDANKDGSITAQEAKAAMERFGGTSGD